MSQRPPESDWKLFRQLREHALERFCERVFQELRPILGDGERTYHERYIEIFRLLKERDRELATAFDNPARSRMLEQLAAMQAHELLEPDELGRFTEGTRAAVQLLVTGIAP
jgi:hypothetical protein